MSKTHKLLTRVRVRLVLAGAMDDLQRGLAIGGVACLAAFGARALGLVSFDSLIGALGGGMVALTAPLVGLFVRRLSEQRVATEADRGLGLEERVSTALWCENSEVGQIDPMEHLVRSDADRTAGAVGADQIRRAFRFRFHRRPVAIGAVAALGCLAVSFYQPLAEATETPKEREARLVQENLNARVARQLKKAAEQMEKAAKERKLPALQASAAKLRREAVAALQKPPSRTQMLSKLNDLRDQVKAAQRKAAGLDKNLEPMQASKADKQLSKLLENMAKAGLESLQKDLADLQKRLDAGEKGESPPSLEEIQAMAERVDALRRALERAAEGGAGKSLREQLRSLGNEDLLADIAKKLREIAQRMQQGQGYQNLQSEGGEPMELSQMSREELEELLRQLEQLAGMEDLEQFLQQAMGASAGGRKLRLGGSGGT